VYILVIGVSIAIGRDLLGLAGSRKLKVRRVLLINNEDDFGEIELRLRAIIKAYKLGEAEIGLIRENLHYQSGINKRLKLCTSDGNGLVNASGLINDIETYCIMHGVEVFLADPLVSLHDSEENNNTAMEVVMGHLRSMLAKSKMGAVLAHHLRKNGEDLPPDDQLRGASSIVAAARVVRVLCRMPPKMVKNVQIDPNERTRYIYLADGKQNYSLSNDRKDWFMLKSIPFDTYDEDGNRTTEFVGVPIPTDVKPNEKATDAELTCNDFVEFFDKAGEEWPIQVSSHYGILVRFCGVNDKGVRRKLECFPLVNNGSKNRKKVVHIDSGTYRVWREKASKTAPFTLHRELAV